MRPLRIRPHPDVEEIGRLCVQLQVLRQRIACTANDARGIQILAGETMKIEPEPDITQTEKALLNIGLYFAAIDLGMDVIMKISELHVFTDSAKSSFELAETHTQVKKLSRMGAVLIKETAKNAGFNDYEKILRYHIKNLEKKAKEEN